VHFLDNRGREQFDPASVYNAKTLGDAGPPVRTASETVAADTWLWPRLIQAMPDCDINIATFWSTALPVYLSGKGKPVYFMQHYEEVFYPPEPEFITQRLGARSSYSLPIYKIANSSWLQKLIHERFGQNIPFSNNALAIGDFNPGPKLSDNDGKIRIITYSRPEQWKGLADAVAAMEIVGKRSFKPVEWNVFGYRHSKLPPDNLFFPYKFHPKLPFHDLAALYSASDIALCPSWYESFPLPPLEAMASGTAVVTTNLGTEDYAFDGKNAVVVDSRDIEKMAAAILRLIENPALRQRLSREGRATAEHFSLGSRYP
jgi:glycosyltransferase involved in cell wall biosynthesis